MKRLKNKLLSMEAKTETYTSVYEGAMTIALPDSPPLLVYEPTYYRENIGFTFERSHRLALDKPTITITIPQETLFIETTGAYALKRLKYYLLQMENDTTTYHYKVGAKQKDIYDGEVNIVQYKKDGGVIEPVSGSDPTFWNNEISYTLEKTNKLAVDKPTLTIGIDAQKLGIEAYTAAAADYCLRAFRPYIDELNIELYNKSRPDKENGRYYLYNPGGEVLVRNSAFFKLCPQKDYINGPNNTVYVPYNTDPPKPVMSLCIRMQVQLPFKKLRKTIQMLCKDLPDAVEKFTAFFDCRKLDAALELAERQAAIRAWLKHSEYCAFIANNSILPRFKGSDLPMKNALPFKSTPEDEIEVCGIRGMGIRRGVTVITGGGYSGKSTLLDAISAGIYDHAEGDGRELVITDDKAVKISAEDGRSVKNVNISPFIKWIPGGDTSDFSTEHASGSTSQAANIMEAVNYGSKLLLIDEDKSATNFMIRDRMMKELIEKEPITPFTDRVNELYKDKNVSTILVIGGSGEYLTVADKIYMMDEFKISDVTRQAKQISGTHGITNTPPIPAKWSYHRTLLSEHFTSYPEGSGSERLEVSDMGFILIGDERIDIRMLHNIITPAQLNTIGFILRRIETSNSDKRIDIKRRLDDIYLQIDKEGLDCVFSTFFTTCERFLDQPRKFEVMAVINRMRKIKFVIDET